MVSKITDRIIPQVRERQSRPLNPVYPFVFMDCIHYKGQEDWRILSRAAYVALGVTAEGHKEILSIQAVFPKVEIQRCVIHMLCNPFRYADYKDLKKSASEL